MCTIPSICWYHATVGLLVLQAQESSAQTFFKTIGLPGTDETAQCLQATNDGNFVIGGSKGDSALVTMVDGNGTVLWSRAFQAITGYQNVVYQIATTPEGDLVGTGNCYSSNPYPHFTFLFKCDLLGNLLWHTISDDDRPIWTNRIIPNSAAEYMVLPCIYNLNSPTLSDLCAGKVDANTGAMLSMGPRTDFTPMNPGLDEHFSAAIAPDQSVYACGRVFLGGNAIGSMRPHVSHYTPSGQLLWARSFVFPVIETARIYAIDMIYNDDSLTVCYFGNIDGAASTYNVGLIRMDTAGNVAWTKDYDLTAYTSDLSYKVLRMPYGYAISGYGVAPDRDLFILAVDLDGEVLWANSYGTPGAAEFLTRTVTPNAVAIGSHILFTGTQEITGDQNIIVARVDATGSMDCDVVSPIDVVVTSIAPFSMSLAPMEYPDDVPFIAGPIETNTVLLVDACMSLAPNLGPDTMTCEPYTLSAFLQGATYLWSTGASGSDIIVTEPDTIWVRLTMGCCTGADTVIISGGMMPEAIISATVPSCGDLVQLASLSTGATELIWELGDGTFQTELEFDHLYPGPGSYSIYLMASNSCGSDTTLQVISFPERPFFTITGPSVICDEAPVTLSMSYGGIDELHTLWSTGDTTSSITIAPVDGTLIELNGSDDQGCEFHAEYLITLATNDVIAAANVPNVFTPNRDGSNDFFGPMITSGFKEMVIYNRWGQVVYETIEPNKPWQGDCEGTPSPDGTYFYIIRWENECGGIPGEHFGHVTLLR